MSSCHIVAVIFFPPLRYEKVDECGNAFSSSKGIPNKSVLRTSMSFDMGKPFPGRHIGQERGIGTDAKCQVVSNNLIHSSNFLAIHHTPLSLLHPLSNRAHSSTFQLFNLSTAPKARAPRVSRCLPPRLLLDVPLQQKHPLTQRLPMNSTNQKISRRDAESAEKTWAKKGAEPQAGRMSMATRT